MQAVRAMARQAGLLPQGARAFAGNTISAGKAAHGNPVVDLAGVFIVLPIALGAIVADTLYPEEEFHGKIPHYPYMRMREAKPGGFPWGPDGLMEYHPHVNTD